MCIYIYHGLLSCPGSQAPQSLTALNLMLQMHLGQIQLGNWCWPVMGNTSNIYDHHTRMVSFKKDRKVFPDFPGCWSLYWIKYVQVSHFSICLSLVYGRYKMGHTWEHLSSKKLPNQEMVVSENKVHMYMYIYIYIYLFNYVFIYLCIYLCIYFYIYVYI